MRISWTPASYSPQSNKKPPHTHTHAQTHSTPNTISVSLCGHSIQSALLRDRWAQRFDLYSWAVVSQNTHTHFKTRSLFEEMTSSSASVPPRSRLAGNPSHHSRDYPSEWLLHALWGIATMRVTTDTPLRQQPPQFPLPAPELDW